MRKHEESLGFTKQKRQNILIRLILISLFAHLIFTYFFIEHGCHKKALWWIDLFNKELTAQEQEKQAQDIKQKRNALISSLHELKKEPRNTLPAQLCAPKSKFGWVLFDSPSASNREQETPLQIPTTIDGSVAESVSSHATEDEHEIPERQLPQTPEALEPTPQISETQLPEASQTSQDSLSTQEQQESPPDLAQATVHVSENQSMQSASQTVLAPVEHCMQENSHISGDQPRDHAINKKIPSSLPQGKESEHRQDSTSPSSLKQNAQLNQRGRVHVRGAQASKSSPRRNLLALTKGFIEKREGPFGIDLVDRYGDPHKRPDSQEFKYLSYEAKISWCLQASWKQNFQYIRMQRTLFKEDETPIRFNAIFSFVVDLHGNVTNSTLLQSTGNNRVDKMIMKNIQFASPYPPIPKHLGSETYTVRRTLLVCED